MRKENSQETGVNSRADSMRQEGGNCTSIEGDADRFIRKNRRHPGWKTIIGVEIMAIILAQLVIIVFLLIVIARVWF